MIEGVIGDESHPEAFLFRTEKNYRASMAAGTFEQDLRDAE